MKIDNHIHIGWYSDGYHSPREVWKAIHAVGVDEIAVSSTSTCCEAYKLVARELKELKRLGGASVHPILWLTPRMLKTYGLRYMLHCGVEWEGVKMHWLAHPEWAHNRSLLNKAIGIVRDLNTPLLLHSGEHDCCQPHLFAPVCEALNDTTIIIAHGRPINQTISLMKAFSNTMVDTAFMPKESLKALAKEGMLERIIFGTDTPIPSLFTSLPIQQCIINDINNLYEVMGKEKAEVILSRTPFK